METNRLKELSRIYELRGSDFQTQNYGNNPIVFMKKSGIDKIQAIENIEIDFEPIESLCIPNENVAFKVTAKWKDKIFHTIGEANTKNSKVSYLGCMAENRGRGRAILTLCGFATEGVFSADTKWEADELNNSK
jgi:hypothetical protein|tara:strand:+ start:7023 stop:7424 length:402 start_codon:yes stop_codon:yes gene_type:complete